MDDLLGTGIYIIAFAIAAFVVLWYIRSVRKQNRETKSKIVKAKEFGLHEPITLHPVIDQGMCIGSGACVDACPEKDILGIINGRVATINTSRCVGHGACFHACPVEAITLCIGTEKRGIDLPHVNQDFESNVSMLYIAGELGGMGLIKNSIEQGKYAVENLTKKLNRNLVADFDVIIIGAGPAGFAASLAAQQNKLSYLTLDQDTLGGTVYHFPRAKIIMTSPVDLPLHGKVKLVETSKKELLDLWSEIRVKFNLNIRELEKVLSVRKESDIFHLSSVKQNYTAKAIVLAIGRRGTPRKLGVPGEETEKVYYKLIEPELLKEQDILVVGGGDSAIETALLLADEGNKVTISYRSDAFGRLKAGNLDKISKAIKNNAVKVLYSTTVSEIKESEVILSDKSGKAVTLPNNLVYVLIGGELPSEFIRDIGISITKKFGEAILSHKKD